MHARTLGHALKSSAMGLGCMSMSGAYGSLDDAESRATLHLAVELGITLFDTADVYGPFANESFIGHGLKPYRHKVLYATKFGLVRSSSGQHLGVNGTPDYVRQCCTLSLQQLGTDYIDLYLQHRVDPNTPIEDTVGAMGGLVEQGKVRFIGLSEAGAETIRRAHAVHPISVVQSEYSLWSRDVEDEVLPVCRELDIGFIAYSPLGRGFLTGAIASATDLATGDYRVKDPRFKGEAFDVNRVLLRSVESIAVEVGCTPAQLALAWVLSRGDDIVPIPGTKRRATLRQNVAALEVPLSPELIGRLDACIPPGATRGDRYADMSDINPTTVRDRS